MRPRRWIVRSPLAAVALAAGSASPQRSSAPNRLAPAGLAVGFTLTNRAGGAVFVVLLLGLIGLGVHRLGWSRSLVLAVDTLLVAAMLAVSLAVCAQTTSAPQESHAASAPPAGAILLMGGLPGWQSICKNDPTGVIPPARCAMLRRFVATWSAPWPADAQPPDPCGLLTAADVRAGVGTSLAQTQSTRASGMQDVRSCQWSAPTGQLDACLDCVSFVGLSVSTQAAIKERVLRKLYVDGGTPRSSVLPTALDQMSDDILHGYMNNGIDSGNGMKIQSTIPGLGDRASLAVDSGGGFELRVLVGAAFIQLYMSMSSSDGPLPHPSVGRLQTPIIALARQAVAHLHSP